MQFDDEISDVGLRRISNWRKLENEKELIVVHTRT